MRLSCTIWPLVGYYRWVTFYSKVSGLPRSLTYYPKLYLWPRGVWVSIYCPYNICIFLAPLAANGLLSLCDLEFQGQWHSKVNKSCICEHAGYGFLHAPHTTYALITHRLAVIELFSLRSGVITRRTIVVKQLDAIVGELLSCGCRSSFRFSVLLVVLWKLAFLFIFWFRWLSITGLSP